MSGKYKGGGGGGGNLPHSIIGIQAMHLEGEGGYLLGSKGCRERMKGLIIWIQGMSMEGKEVIYKTSGDAHGGGGREAMTQVIRIDGEGC